jgi:hypothetical protein
VTVLFNPSGSLTLLFSAHPDQEDIEAFLFVLGKQEAAKAFGNITGRRGKSSRVVKPRRFVGIGPAHERTIHTILEEHIKRRFLITDPDQVLVKRIA